ncbi:hypothetical protein [Embleya sp. NPDC020886]|uniref:hypothetical protein n=1 Tax=Embleya sp. NPDC020886 TaxID=3363980 RepID=UPI00379922E1
MDQLGAETLACVRHGAVLYASLLEPHVYPGPGGRDGDAAEVHHLGRALRPFAFAADEDHDITREIETYLRYRGA